MDTLAILSIILATIITIAILYGDTLTTNTETKEKLWFRAYTIYMKIAIVLMVIIAVMPISTFTIVFAMFHIIVILNKDIALADAETKGKLWFKTYVAFMRFMIAVIIFLGMDGMKFW